MYIMGDTATERGIQARTYPLSFQRKTFFPIDSKVDQITYRFQSMTINEELVGRGPSEAFIPVKGAR